MNNWIEFMTTNHRVITMDLSEIYAIDPESRYIYMKNKEYFIAFSQEDSKRVNSIWKEWLDARGGIK